MGNRSVSVIIPVYNTARYLHEALESVRLQEFDGEIEVICVDDGSTDGSYDILLRYQKENEGEFAGFQVISQENSGMGCARNKGLEVARGAYVYFLDSDDFIEPNTFQLAVDRAEKLSLDIVIWDVWYYNDRAGRDQHPPVGTLDFSAFVDYSEQDAKYFCASDNPDAVFTSFQNWAWNKLYRRSFLEGKGLRFPSLFRTEDLEFSCMAFVLADRIGLIYERLSHYRIKTGTSSLDTKDRYPYDFITAFVSLRKELKDAGLYETYKISYARWALSGMIYNLNTLNDPTTFQNVFERLANGAAEEMGLFDVDPDDYLNQLELEGLHMLYANKIVPYLLYWIRNYNSFIDDDKAMFDHLEARFFSLEDELQQARVSLQHAVEKNQELAVAVDGYLRSAEYRFGKKMLKIPRAIKSRLEK